MQRPEEFAKEIINQKLGASKVDLRALTGGCISTSFKASVPGADYFIKVNSENKSLFESEAKGLRMLKESNSISIPEVLFSGVQENYGYIILEFVNTGSRGGGFWEKFAVSLANLHRKSSDFYGLDFDNFIGALPQYNIPNANWVDFFIEQRLERQIKLAIDSGLVGVGISGDFHKLFNKLPELLISESPALIHGDLWSGNFIVNSRGEATLIDPAIYYGNREIELAFTTLFGGFDQEFYSIYEDVFPLTPGFEERFEIYNLYPLLVHVNLFGTSYLGAVKNILKRLV